MVKRLLLALALLALPTLAAAQGTITPSPYQTVLDSNGDPINGGCVWTYVAGSSTPAATYTDSTLGSANTNPIQADPAGRFTAFLTPGNSYKFQYETACTPPAHGSIFRTADNISAVSGVAAGVDVVGTAGETILAGQCVYLSDGSGSKTPGSWYLCKSDNAYSNTAPVAALAPSAVTSGSSGSFRISGQVTGLSGLVVGGHYFVSSTSGSLATAGSRELGQADSATSLVVTGANRVQPLTNAPMAGRLSLTTGVCVPTGDVTAATTIYYVPCAGNVVWLYNGTAWQSFAMAAQLSIAVPATTNTAYDVYLYNNSGTLTLELTAWTNTTTRATALVLQDGVYVKTGATTRRYLGSFATTGSSGQTEDSLAKRDLCNVQNLRERTMRVTEATDSWNYSGVFRQANNAATNQLEFFQCVQENTVEASVVVTASGNASGTPMYVGIGLDSTTTRATGQLGSATYTLNVGIGTTLGAAYKDAIAVGRHTLVWLESGGAATITWYGDNGGTGVQSGIHGTIWN